MDTTITSCDSIKEYLTALGYWGWLVVVVIAFGVIGVYLNITGQKPVTEWPFPLWAWATLALAGLIGGPFFAFHKKAEKLRALVGTRPALTVISLIEPDDREGNDAGYLRIHNEGSSCQIEAMGSITGGEIENARRSSVWPIPWRDKRGHNVILPKGGTLILGIQAQILKAPPSNPPYKHILKFERFSGDELVHESTGWSPSEASPSCVIRINITSDPSILGEVRPYDYELALSANDALI